VLRLWLLGKLTNASKKHDKLHRYYADDKAAATPVCAGKSMIYFSFVLTKIVQRGKVADASQPRSSMVRSGPAHDALFDMTRFHM
jgi:hypothetical protein